MGSGGASQDLGSPASGTTLQSQRWVRLLGVGLFHIISCEFPRHFLLYFKVAHPCLNAHSYQAASLDYIKAPSSNLAMPEKKSGGSKGKDEHKLTKKLNSMAKGARNTGRAAVVSVEGRNVTVQH